MHIFSRMETYSIFWNELIQMFTLRCYNTKNAVLSIYVLLWFYLNSVEALSNFMLYRNGNAPIKQNNMHGFNNIAKRKIWNSIMSIP